MTCTCQQAVKILPYVPFSKCLNDFKSSVQQTLQLSKLFWIYWGEQSTVCFCKGKLCSRPLSYWIHKILQRSNAKPLSWQMGEKWRLASRTRCTNPLQVKQTLWQDVHNEKVQACHISVLADVLFNVFTVSAWCTAFTPKQYIDSKPTSV